MSRPVTIEHKNHLEGEVTVPGDKSISHRIVMMGAIADGISEADGFLTGSDCLSTIGCFRAMGADIKNAGDHVVIHGVGLHGLKKPSGTLNTGNSGTTTRIMSGLLAPQPFTSLVNGDESVDKRPMNRIMIPLRQMGAHIDSIRGNDCAPLIIEGQKLKGIQYHSPVASAQVKSCIMMAGLYADGKTRVYEPEKSRNHTELMLRAFGADVSETPEYSEVSPVKKLTGIRMTIPGDISSAVYFIVAGLITEGSEITVKNVGINPTRDGIIETLENMGADITLENKKISGGEPVADITVRSCTLHGTEIYGAVIPRMIDEIPTIALAACFADGTTVIRDAAELKVKESDRISVMTSELKKMGADITATDDGFIIHGGRPLHGAHIDPRRDHRIAMTMAVAGLAADGETVIEDPDCVNISYPDFFKTLAKL